MTHFDVHTTSNAPTSPGADLGPNRDWPVREAVGSLLWLSIMTLPDITNAVGAVVRYAHSQLRGTGKR